MAPDANCSRLFHDGILAGNPNITQYQYNGTVRGIYDNTDTKPLFITWQGCRVLCGNEPAYYDWTAISATISTWVLPVVGLLLQAPFESNAFWKTIIAMTHWIGSPISSLSAILWNVKVFGQCSLIVDMSTTFDSIPAEGSQYEQIRDSFYILSMMNQFSIKQTMPRITAERLLRVALFSDTLQLETEEDDSRNLVKRRRKLARVLREGRKKGIVPVFISLMWFLFSLVISIQQAFGQLGYNATAHNLALGLLLSWLPTLILCSIVDRNPVQPDAVRNKLNKLVNAVRKALLNPELRDTYIKETNRPVKNFSWTAELSNDDLFHGDFFTRFAGQGRVRWHYGIAHGILAGIERSYVAKRGRNWLRNSEEARSALVRGPPDMHGFDRKFDPHELWQMLASILIVGLAVFGAFTISYSTPTIGLGCRSGGYLIFFILASTSLVIELICWRWLPPDSMWDDDPITKLGSRWHRKASRGGPGHQAVSRLLERFIWWWQNFRKRDLVEIGILRPLEFINTIWLIYIVLSQTVGAYTTCDCQCSIWDRSGGYMDFESQVYYLQLGIGMVWGIGTAMGCVQMLVGFAYIVLEWCLQSNLSTVNYDAARRGLKTARQYRRLVQPISRLLNFVKTGVLAVFIKIFRRGDGESMRRLRWTAGPKLEVTTVDDQDQDESAIDDHFISPLSNPNSHLFALDTLTSLKKSFDRSPRSSFGPTDETIHKPRSFS